MNFFGFHITRNKKKRRAYDAADKGRRAKNFRLAGSTGVNREVSGALVTIRNRSRHLGRNNGWCKRGVEAITRHTIGEGIQPAPDTKFQQTSRAKELWQLWAKTTACDWYEKTTFYGLQELAMRTIVEGGEVLILKRWIDDAPASCPVPLKLQVLEGDHLDHTRNGVNKYEIDGITHSGLAFMGVQFDQRGRLVGYWLFDYHPGESDFFSKHADSMFYPKCDVIHAYEVLRPGQVRGLPMGVAAFMKTQDFSDYEDAQLYKQKVAACFCAFVYGSDMSTDEKARDEIENMEPGGIGYLNDGESIVFADPPTISDYDNYSTRILQGTAAAYGITYEMLTMDYSRVNFTSGRMAKLDVKKNFDSWQYHTIVPQVCAPVWDWFLNACIAYGGLDGYIPADWTAPRIPLLDPVKEVTAQVMQIKSGLTTLSESIRENGREPTELLEEYKQDADTLKKFGINVDSINLNTTGDAKE